MRRRNWGTMILINVIISAIAVLTVLFLWDRTRTGSPIQLTTTVPAIESETSVPPSPVTGVAPTSEPVSAPDTPEPTVYIVKEGDTLVAIAIAHGVDMDELIAINQLADPNVLHPGQSLLIPIHDPATPSGDPSPSEATQSPVEPDTGPTPLPSPTPSGPPLIEIAHVLGSGDLAAEMVVLRNRGGVGRLQEWKLSDVQGSTFTFPALTLYTNAEVRVHTGEGINTPTDLYWNRAAPAWSAGELVTLQDASGSVVDTYIVP